MNINISLLTTALDNLHEAIYILDKHGNFIYVNQAYCELVGADFDIISRYSVHDLLRLGYINHCIFDDVCRTKSEVTVFQEAGSRMPCPCIFWKIMWSYRRRKTVKNIP